MTRQHVGFIGNGPDIHGRWCHVERENYREVIVTVETLEGVPLSNPERMSQNDYSALCVSLFGAGKHGAGIAQAACMRILMRQGLY